MENASKALIIAGAILVAILLISVGILVMNSINQPLEQGKNEADSLAAQIFNKKYKMHAGNNKTAEEARELFVLVNSNTDTKHKIGFYRPNTEGSHVYTNYIIDMDAIDNSCTYQIVANPFYWESGTKELTSGQIYYPGASGGTNIATGQPGYVYMIQIIKEQ